MNPSLWRVALAAAHRDHPQLTSDELAELCTAVQTQAVERMPPAQAWELLVELLMSPHPGHGLAALRQGGALKRWLPEVDALFGVPQLSDLPTPVDVGEHVLSWLEETAQSEAPLSVRFAALAQALGKGGTPREIWPTHYKHEQRGHVALNALMQRLEAPDALGDLAHLGIDEVERVHRASDMRAGAIASMLQRLQALERPVRFEMLLILCTCGYAAFPGHTQADYPKADRLRRALDAYRDAPVKGLDAEEAMLLRAQAVDRVLRGARTAST